MQIINNKMAKRNKKNNDTYMRIDKDILNKIAQMRLPIANTTRWGGDHYESFAQVIRRLLNDPKIRAKMKKDQQEAWK